MNINYAIEHITSKKLLVILVIALSFVGASLVTTSASAASATIGTFHTGKSTDPKVSVAACKVYTTTKTTIRVTAYSVKPSSALKTFKNLEVQLLTPIEGYYRVEAEKVGKTWTYKESLNRYINGPISVTVPRGTVGSVSLINANNTDFASFDLLKAYRYNNKFDVIAPKTLPNC